MTFHLVLAESALELVPESMRGHPAAGAHARRLGRPASETLLDVSWHYAAMRGAPDAHRRGRPDLVHQAVLAAVATPLYRDGLVRLYVHTIRDVVVRFGGGVRVPKSYHRFEGLFAKLLREGHAGGGEALLEASGGTVPSLLREIDPPERVGLSRAGRPVSCRQMAAGLEEGACVVVGGFQRGGFSDTTAGALDRVCSISPQPLETHLVVGRLLYDVEAALHGGRDGA